THIKALTRGSNLLYGRDGSPSRARGAGRRYKTWRPTRLSAQSPCVRGAGAAPRPSPEMVVALPLGALTRGSNLLYGRDGSPSRARGVGHRKKTLWHKLFSAHSPCVRGAGAAPRPSAEMVVALPLGALTRAFNLLYGRDGSPPRALEAV